MVNSEEKLYPAMGVSRLTLTEENDLFTAEITCLVATSTTDIRQVKQTVKDTLDTLTQSLHNCCRDRTVAPTRETWVQLPLFTTSD